MKILRATPTHLSQVAVLFDLYRQFYRQPSDAEGALRFLQARMEADESVILLAVAESVEKAMGFVQLYPSFSSVSMKRLWVLNDLFVHPDFRKQGVGEGLLQAARKHALETGAKGLMLETEVHNQAAQALYEKLGWVRSREYYVYNLTL